MARKHNKSNIIGLRLLENSDEKISDFAENITRSLKDFGGLIQDSPCYMYKTQDGRYTEKQKKIAYAYQIIAFEKFGREELSKVAASKTQDDLVISHLCGTRNCCNRDHLVLEKKAINDERTRCHWCLSNAKNAGGLKHFHASNACPHVPKCGTSPIKKP